MTLSPITKSLRAALFAITFVFTSTMSRAQSVPMPTNSGTDFLLCFEQNDAAEHTAFDSALCELYLANLSDSTRDTVIIHCRHYPTGEFTVILAPSEIKSQRLTDTWSDLWVTGTDSSIDDRVVNVHATGPTACYGMNYKINTADAFAGIPINQLGTDYRVISYPSSTFLLAAMPAQFCVAAVSDSTHVTITPSTATSTGKLAGVPFSIVLDAGQCVQVQTDPTMVGSDLTRSVVASDKPVAVFAGSARAEVPNGFTGPSGTVSRDHMEKALPSTDHWGHSFIISQVDTSSANAHPRTSGDILRILALQNNTTISINGMPARVLSSDTFFDTVLHGVASIESSAPILVAEFLHSSESPGSDTGDPSMIIIPPIDSISNAASFYLSQNPAFVLNKCMLIGDTAALHHVFLDGIPINQFLYTVTPVTGLKNGRSYGVMQLDIRTGGAHIVAANVTPDKGFLAIPYGLGTVIGYAFPAANSVVKLPIRFHDLSVDTFISASFEVGVPKQPIVTTRNYGTQLEQGAKIAMAISYNATVVYRDTQTVQSIDNGTSLHIFFANWTPAHAGLHRFCSYVLYPVDQDTSNNSSCIGVNVLGSTNSVDESTDTHREFEVYPNPASNTLTVSSLSKDSKFVIIDDLGREVLRGELRPGEALNVASLNDGIYYLQRNASGRTDATKIVIAH